MNLPVCSVVIPAYNCLAYLPRALDSIADQHVEDVEILVLDDGSTDGTWDWLGAQDATRPGLRRFAGGKMGPARGRNILIREAKAEFVAFLDADDLWLPGKLAAEIAFHRANPEVVLTFTDYVHETMAGERRSTCFDFWKPAWLDRARPGFRLVDKPLDALLGANVVGTSCVVAKRDALREIGGFSESLPSAEDWDLWLRLAERGPIAVAPSATMAYLMRPGGETCKRQARIAAMRSIIDRYDGKVARAAVNAARARLSTAVAEDAKADGRRWTSVAAGLRAFALAPSRRSARAAFSGLAVLRRDEVRP